MRPRVFLATAAAVPLMLAACSVPPGPRGPAGAPSPRTSPPATLPAPAGPVAQEAPVLTTEEKVLLYERGLHALECGIQDDARRDWERIWEVDPGFRNVANLLKREYQIQGLEAYARNDLEEAARLWTRALEIDPGDRKSAGYLRWAEDQMRLLQESRSRGPTGR